MSTQPRTLSPNTVDWATGAGIVLLALLVRLFRLGKDSLWYDEIGQALAAEGSLWQTVINAAGHEGSTPLDYVITHLALHVGRSEIVLRFPAVIWGTGAVVVLYCLGRLLFDRRVAALAALMLALSPLHVFYSQEVRFYSLATFMALLSCYTFCLAVRSNRRWTPWLLYAVVHVLALYAHYYVLLVTIAQALWLVVGVWNQTYPRRTLWSFLGAAGLAVLLFLPWMYYDIVVVANGTLGVGSPFNLPGWTFYLGLFYVPGPPITVFALAIGVGLWVTCIVAALLTTRRRFQWRSELLLPVLVVLVGIPGITFLNYIGSYWFRERQLLPFIPFVLLTISVVLCTAINRVARGNTQRVTTGAVVLVAALYAAYTVPSLAFIYTTTTLRDDWRGVGHFLVEHAGPNDLVLAQIPSHLAFYTDGLKGDLEGFTIDMTDDEAAAWIEDLSRQYDHIWFVIRGNPGFAVNTWIKERALAPETFTALNVYEYSSP